LAIKRNRVPGDKLTQEKVNALPFNRLKLFIYNKDHRLILSANAQLEAEETLKYYVKSWTIEPKFNQLKNNLGLGIV